MANEPVKVYIYDLSKGMARTMSRAFLGKQIDGIWHTGIVVFGQEFYFGGLGGIESCPPGGLQMLGQPNEIVDLGTTEIPFEIFMDHLRELATTTFRGECYHLLDHNCNTFSNELAMFLTGRPIPSHITSLPQDVLSTPFGSMIRPMLDSMQVNPGGSQVFPNSHAGGAQVFPGNAASANTHSSSNAANTTATQGKNDYFPKTTYLSFDSAKIPNIIEKLKEFNKNVPSDLQEREILLEQLDTLAEGKESRIEQLNTLKKILKWPASFVFPALDLLRLSMRHVKINNHFCGIDNSSDFIELLKTHLSPSSPPANQMLCLRTMCNTFLHPSGETILMLNAATIIAALKESSLTRDKNTQVAACSVVLNYSVVCLKRNGTETSKLCLGVVNKIARESTNLDAEAAFRLLVAIGNFASVDKSVCEELGREVYGEIKRFVEARSKQKDGGKVYDCAVLVLFKVC